MNTSVEARLLKREVGYFPRTSSIWGVYGDKTWINDLDIVNELGGHSGCVNALSWSKSGRLLASGSDDTNLLIHSYQPESSSSPFLLTTSLSTGHTANIFSVKFMPHSNDNTLVTAAGDSEVRVFDLEYNGKFSTASDASSIASSRQRLGLGTRGLTNMYQGVNYLSDGNTNAKVYRSHSDRVKRIVTESSPYLFLTCSEDGTVRQWDLRMPSSAYPQPPRRVRGFLRDESSETSKVPPPLISYSHWRMDLNTISCSASQPHYIVLGGAHLHCFLHDRRMVGRDLLAEQGVASTSSDHSDSGMSAYDDDRMGHATRCVRRFAPHGKRKMGRSGNGHVTACKISDASPNEFIASWSGDHIYSFDLIRSPDAREQPHKLKTTSAGIRSNTKESRDRKRKRQEKNSTASLEGLERGSSRARRANGTNSEDGDLALRVRYENGQSEDIPIEHSISDATVEEAHLDVLSDSQKRSLAIARSVVKIRKLLFSSDASSDDLDLATSLNLSNYASTFSSTLGVAAAQLSEMDEIIRTWAYPVDPYESERLLHRTLRRNRDSSRRFVQAAGTLARVLGGSLRTPGPGPSTALQYFDQIKPTSTEAPDEDTTHLFSYELLRAILLWLESGPQGLLHGFQKSQHNRRRGSKYPIPEGYDESGIEEYLVPYLESMAGPRAIVNLDVSRFEIDMNRIIFPDEKLALDAFRAAVRKPIRRPTESPHQIQQSSLDERAVDLDVVMKLWGFKIGRSLLMNGGEGVNFALVDRAFGGLGIPRKEHEGRSQEDINPNEDEDEVVDVHVVTSRSRLQPKNVISTPHDDAGVPEGHGSSTVETSQEDEASSAEALMPAIMHEDLLGQVEADSTSEENDDDGDSDSDQDGDDNGHNDENDDEFGISFADSRFIWQSKSERARLRETMGNKVPVGSHCRQYKGHCNVKTVKDVNYFGLQDEYVVSGSDSGHLFIWNKKTSQIVNILEGDGEVVNVAQGHPYEPMIAVSGIDHTIKIFSADRRAQCDARLGINLGISTNNSTSHSSLRWPGTRSRRPRSDDSSTERQTDATSAFKSHQLNDSDSEEVTETPLEGSTSRNGLASRRRMHDSYQIIAQNDVDRQGGMRDAYVTRSMLAQLAAHIRRRRTDGDEADGGEDETIVMDDDCVIM